MPAQAKPNETPETVTPQGGEPQGEGEGQETVVVKTSDDVKKLLEKVRAEEKKKLYPQIEHHKSQAETLKAQNELLAKRLKDLEEEDGKKRTEKMSEAEKIQTQLKTLQEQNILLQKQQEALVNESRAQMVKMSLETYKARALAQSGGELIPELVYGESEAEIDAAILASKNRYREIVANAKQALKQSNAQAPVPGPSGVPPQNKQSAPSGEELTAEMLGRMSPEEWAKERLNIRRQVDGTMKQFFRGR